MKKSYQELRPYIGHPDQLFSLREYCCTQGKARGMRVIEADNGAGIQFTVLPDRCMDFYQLKYRGNSLNYITAAGMVAPAFFDAENWLYNFAGGLLTTCGLDNIGVGGLDEGKKYGMHGLISSIPADSLGVWVAMEEQPVLKLCGVVRQAAQGSGTLTLRREIACPWGGDSVFFTDTITNEGCNAMPYMVLYHFNFGYPLLSPAGKLEIPSQNVKARTPYAEQGVATWSEILPPQPGYEEMCFYHQMEQDAQGRVTYGISNPEIATRLQVTYDGRVLDHFVQWKMYAQGEYVTGLEPCNATIDGRDDARANGSLKYLAPGESVQIPFTLHISDL